MLIIVPIVMVAFAILATIIEHTATKLLINWRNEDE